MRLGRHFGGGGRRWGGDGSKRDWNSRSHLCSKARRSLLVRGAIALSSASAAPAYAIADEELVDAEIEITGMSCASCAASVAKRLRAVEGLRSVHVSTSFGVAYIRCTERCLASGSLLSAVRSAGFDASIRDGALSAVNGIRQKQAKRQQQLRQSNARTLHASSLALLCAITHLPRGALPFPVLRSVLHSNNAHAAISLLAMCGPGRHIITKGFPALIRGEPTMDSLISLGVLSSASLSSMASVFPSLGWQTHWHEPIMLIALVSVGRALEERAQLQASSDLSGLASAVPQQARVIVQQPSSSIAQSSADQESMMKKRRKGEHVENSSFPQGAEVEQREEQNSLQMRTRPTNALSADDVVRVESGETVPVDGIVFRGSAYVDDSLVTGEPIPVCRGVGARVRAGSQLCNGCVDVAVEGAHEETRIASVVRLVQQAQSRAAPVQRMADIASGHFANGVIATSALTFLTWRFAGPRVHAMTPWLRDKPVATSLQRATSVLAVACPCALGLATPTAVLVATSLGARNGLLIRGGDVLQTASNVDTVVFDKTGTLTQGKPRVVNVQPQPGYTAKDVLQLAAAVECHSSHPLAQAIVSSAADATGSDLLSSDQSTFNQPAGAGIEGYVNGESVLVGSIHALQARGVSTHAQPLSLRNGALQEQEGYRRREEAVEASFKERRNAHNAGPTLQASRTPVHVAHNAQYIGTITLADEMRSEAKQTVSLLKQAGVRNFPILSGDTQAAAEQLAGIIGIEQNHANGCVEPERKADIVQTLRNEGHTVAVVGDGINDAGALATADVGIAIGSGAAAANDAAGIVLLQDDLRLAADALRLSKRAMATVRANLGMSLLYNGVSIPLAAGAMLPVWGVSLSPSLAGGLMGISSVSVVTSSLSIKLWQPRSHFERKKDPAKAKNNSESAAASAAA